MAEDKKSFILYVDQRGVFEKLSDDQAGKLIKHIFSYCNDEDPEGDFVTELAFELIMQQLKRDLKKYQNIVERNKKNGSKGGRPRKQEKPEKPSGLFGNPEKPQKADTVNGNDTVIDNVTVKDIIKNPSGDSSKEKIKKLKKEKPIPIEIIMPFDSEDFLKWWSIWKRYKKEEKKFTYRSPVSEIGALKKLVDLSKGIESTAIKIIEESISNGWAGFFELNTQNGNNKTGNQKSSGATDERIAEIYSGIFGKES